MVLNAKDFEKDLFRPAIEGTTTLLKAVKDSDAKISRVVITSSFASMYDPLQGLRPGYAYTETDWNPVTKEVVAESNNAILAYLASKTFAEKAAFDFVEKEKVR